MKRLIHIVALSVSLAGCVTIDSSTVRAVSDQDLCANAYLGWGTTSSEDIVIQSELADREVKCSGPNVAENVSSDSEPIVAYFDTNEGIKAVITFPNGSRYEGDVLKGQPHGLGEAKFRDGSSYEGEFDSGRMHGQGTGTFPDGQRYVGEWKDDLPHGSGTRIWVEGAEYVGDFRNGLRTGRGTMTRPSGSKYIGDWKEGQKHGQGTKTWADGDKYVGEYKEGNRHGHGTHTNANGNKYVGEWKDDNQHGHGTHTWGKGEWEGDKYVGEWKDGEQHQGTYTWSDGRKYVGEYKGPKMHGQGTYTWPNRTAYSGKFHEDRIADGKGIFISPDGTRSPGTFKDGGWVYAKTVKDYLPQSTYSGKKRSRDPYASCLGYSIGIAMVGGDVSAWMKQCMALKGKSWPPSSNMCIGMYCGEDYAWDYLPGSNQWRCRDTGGFGGGQFSASHLCNHQSKIDNWP
jgi:hypothetical protein